jgi:hypothetical protein
VRIGSAYRGVSAKEKKLKNDANQISNGRVQTPTNVGGKKSTKVPDQKVEAWLDMTDKRGKIYDDMMNHMKAENHAKIGPKAAMKIKGGRGYQQGQAFSHGTPGEGKFVPSTESLKDRLDTDLELILSD